MKTDYQQLYQSYLSPEQVAEIKRHLLSDSNLPWEEYYWGTKCIIEYSTEPTPPDVITDMLNSALRQGLTYRLNPELYKDCMKELSAYYTMYGKYELVSNHLNLLIDNYQDVPAWVYHDLIAANIHDNGYIARTLKSPKQFGEDLRQDDGTNEFIKTKQKNLLKEFLRCGANYLSSNPNVRIDYPSIESLINEFGIEGSYEWANFNSVCTGKHQLDETTWDTGKNRTEKKEPARSNEKADNVQIISLKKQVKDLESKLTVLTTEAEKNSSAIAESKKKISELTVDNDILKGRLSEVKLRLEKERTEKDRVKREKDDIEYRLSSLEKEKAAIEKKLFDAEKRVREAAAKADSKTEKEWSKKVDDLKTKISDLEKTIDNYSERLRLNTKELNANKKKVETQEKKIETLEEQIIEKKKECQKIAAFNKEAERQIDDYKAKEKQYITEISDLQEQLSKAKEQTSRPEYGLEDPLHEIYYYIFIITPKVSAKWLLKRIKQLDKNWWKNCVLRYLCERSKSTLQKKSSEDVYDLDLNDIFSVVKGNYDDFHNRNIIDNDDLILIDEMRSVRNKWAHISANGYALNSVLSSIDTIKDYYSLVGAFEYLEELDYLADDIKQYYDIPE